MECIIIVAMASNRTIGKENKIPWHIPDEVRLFKETTIGHTVIMGRKTHESIGSPLPERKNIIITRNKDYVSEGCLIAHSVDEALQLCGGSQKVFILGGEEIFNQVFDITDTILLTVLDRPVEGDTFFPPIPKGKFKEIAQKRISISEPYTIYTYSRI